MLKRRITTALLAGTILLTSAAMGAEDRAGNAQDAVEKAAEYGGAVSIQYALWEEGEITLTGHAGVYSKTEDRALTDDILYGIGSVSKVYTAAAIMKLSEAGRVELDEPVTTYLPGFKMADERYRDITVRMLLNHSSGLMGSSMESTFLFNDPEERGGTDTLLERLSTQELKADPGAYSVYCNDGFTLAQLVVEAVSGMDLGGYLREEFFAPAGLEDTFTPGDGFDRERLAKLYLGEDTRALPPETLGVWGTGGLYATASDLAAFGGLLCGEGALRAESLEAMSAREYEKGLWPSDTDDLVGYGLGWDSVDYPPFSYSGIQALAKGGDTQFYHAGLVVLPEYGLSCAVLSSGGVSTYNELAAADILAGALKERGVELDETPRALTGAERADMPAALLEHAGLYGSNAQMGRIDVSADGKLTLSFLSAPGTAPLEFFYCEDGTFRNAENTAAVAFEELDGTIYLWQKGYSSLPGLGQFPTSDYLLQKFPEGDLAEEEQAVWERRAQKLYLLLNEVYTSQIYAQIIPGTGLPYSGETPGYLLNGMRLFDAECAGSIARIPGLAGRDGGSMAFFEEDGLEYMSAMGSVYMDAAAAQPLWGGAGAYCTVGQDGYARWYTVGELADRTLRVELPEEGAFYVYDANGQPAAGSWAWGDVSAMLPEGGWIVFAGAPGARFQLAVE